MKKIALFGALIFVLSGCSQFGGGESAGGKAAMSGEAAEAQAAIKAASAALKKARGVGGEWRDSNKKMLKKAKAAASKNDFKTAIRLANKAKFEGDMGYAQAMGQKNAGPWLY